MEPIFEAVLANDPAEIAAIVARSPGAAAQRMAGDLFVAELPHMLYRGDTPLHLAAAGLRYADVDRGGIAVADRIHSQALREALAAGQL